MCISRAYGRNSATPASSFAPFAASATTSCGSSVGRLFWKIFIGFWIALVVAAVGAGTAVWVQHHSHDAPPPDLAAGPPSRIVIDLAAATLRHGGVEALRQWMSEVQSRRAMVMFAVDAQGRDALGREAQQLQNLVSAQRRLLHDVSHELRSPLARLHAAIGLARQEPGKLEASLERIEREATRLDGMVGEVLALARLESGTATRAKERVDLAHIAASIAEDARFEAEALGRSVRFTASGDAPVYGNADLLHRAVENVVRNAVKFTRAGTTVDVRVHTTRTSAVLTVSDQGPGITPSELEKVFDPFYRGAAGQGTSGFGLGLAIAQRAVDAHGGAIHAANVAGGGLQVEVELPLAHQ